MLFPAAPPPPTDITPRVALIEIYGTRKISESKIRSVLNVKPGDVPPSRGETEDRLNKISGVLTSRVQVSCCAGRDLVLYVGIEERDSPHIEFHPDPGGKASLSDDLATEYQTFLDAVAGGIRTDTTAQDLTRGYSLMQDTDANAIQHRFLPLVARDLPVLDQVVRTSRDPDARASAAYLLQYAPRGPRTTDVMLNALEYALQDPDESVRQNALRALKAVAVGAKLHKEQGVRVPPYWFVELLNSPVWSDRRDAALALVEQTETRDAAVLQALRERALTSVVEMARWHKLDDALPAFLLAGRLGGLTDDQIRQAWVAGDREAVVKKAISPTRKFKLKGESNT